MNWCAVSIELMLPASDTANLPRRKSKEITNKVRVVIDASRKAVEVIRGNTKSLYPTSGQACAIKCKGFDIVSNFNRGTA